MRTPMCRRGLLVVQLQRAGPAGDTGQGDGEALDRWWRRGQLLQLLERLAGLGHGEGVRPVGAALAGVAVPVRARRVMDGEELLDRSAEIGKPRQVKPEAPVPVVRDDGGAGHCRPGEGGSGVVGEAGQGGHADLFQVVVVQVAQVALVG
ncbi:hypothetical protein [Ornithinicoccus halotolerans]|uniref:hypothetical protein n=1 Tax=Ornithinicoccus halotolerans TaxID=1748220 RepID=UPI0018863C5D|nr:hypothetical protein [Ornithinicoccus halotolerans]